LLAYSVCVHGRYSHYVMTEPVLLAGIRKYCQKCVHAHPWKESKNDEPLPDPHRGPNSERATSLVPRIRN
jgi:hypothetical protein